MTLLTLRTTGRDLADDLALSILLNDAREDLARANVPGAERARMVKPRELPSEETLLRVHTSLSLLILDPPDLGEAPEEIS